MLKLPVIKAVKLSAQSKQAAVESFKRWFSSKNSLPPEHLTNISDYTNFLEGITKEFPCLYFAFSLQKGFLEIEGWLDLCVGLSDTNGKLISEYAILEIAPWNRLPQHNKRRYLGVGHELRVFGIKKLLRDDPALAKKITKTKVRTLGYRNADWDIFEEGVTLGYVREYLDIQKEKRNNFISKYGLLDETFLNSSLPFSRNTSSPVINEDEKEYILHKIISVENKPVVYYPAIGGGHWLMDVKPVLERTDFYYLIGADIFYVENNPGATFAIFKGNLKHVFEILGIIYKEKDIKKVSLYTYEAAFKYRNKQKRLRFYYKFDALNAYPHELKKGYNILYTNDPHNLLSDMNFRVRKELLKHLKEESGFITAYAQSITSKIKNQIERDFNAIPIYRKKELKITDHILYRKKYTIANASPPAAKRRPLSADGCSSSPLSQDGKGDALSCEEAFKRAVRSGKVKPCETGLLNQYSSIKKGKLVLDAVNWWNWVLEDSNVYSVLSFLISADITISFAEWKNKIGFISRRKELLAKIEELIYGLENNFVIFDDRVGKTPKLSPEALGELRRITLKYNWDNLFEVTEFYYEWKALEYACGNICAESLRRAGEDVHFAQKGLVLLSVGKDSSSPVGKSAIFDSFNNYFRLGLVKYYSREPVFYPQAYTKAYIDEEHLLNIKEKGRDASKFKDVLGLEKLTSELLNNLIFHNEANKFIRIALKGNLTERFKDGFVFQLCKTSPFLFSVINAQKAIIGINAAVGEIKSVSFRKIL
ncbi:MAG: hypothetical protein KKH11_03895, partial [Candidatus Omnitrophica bacterium]|nr:hypothetical protein [Candidatus Omnitrophota bacterium]